MVQHAEADKSAWSIHINPYAYILIRSAVETYNQRASEQKKSEREKEKDIKASAAMTNQITDKRKTTAAFHIECCFSHSCSLEHSQYLSQCRNEPKKHITFQNFFNFLWLLVFMCKKNTRMYIYTRHSVRFVCLFTKLQFKRNIA